ncbi:helix-turn-helix domain-containing protein [Erythrobacter aureus]|uniref:DnaA N-terminal domain-containing protein n=1 Tax=Erythrobacter aureus TaxID=2182384 RepID=A0A345YJI5_9SPHN|nr:helix-turn-helix domain-containing protein [Erythrobacter aureus]AXK44087.1 hypothetical protein DVR09_16675 [Erythrobacter aureus]
MTARADGYCSKTMELIQKVPATQLGVAKRHDDWEEITQVSTIGRSTLETIPNYRLIKAATRASASPQARLLLVHLIGYLGMDQAENPKVRFVAFPGNQRLADELGYSKRSIQRLADELEAKGLLRRCYNGINRRTAFDLTPLAMRHIEIEADLVAIQTQRKIEREQKQMELSLEADRIERPVRVTDTSSQGVENDTHNRPNNHLLAVARTLDAVSPDLKREVSSNGDADWDRTGDINAQEVHILSQLSGSGRASHLGWTQAKRQFGFEGALALLAIADKDPKRKASTDRYFGWLLRMALSGNASDIIAQAAKRAANTARSKPTPSKGASAPAPRNNDGATKLSAHLSSVTSPQVVASSSTKARPASTTTSSFVAEAEWNKALRRQLGPDIHDRWFANVQVEQSGSNVILKAPNQFVAQWIGTNFGSAVESALKASTGNAGIKVEYEVA